MPSDYPTISYFLSTSFFWILDEVCNCLHHSLEVPKAAHTEHHHLPPAACCPSTIQNLREECHHHAVRETIDQPWLLHLPTAHSQSSTSFCFCFFLFYILNTPRMKPGFSMSPLTILVQGIREFFLLCSQCVPMASLHILLPWVHLEWSFKNSFTPLLTFLWRFSVLWG